ncbi:hypothetical protein AAC387_Pa01g3348 [Persea americana]
MTGHVMCLFRRCFPPTRLRNARIIQLSRTWNLENSKRQNLNICQEGGSEQALSKGSILLERSLCARILHNEEAISQVVGDAKEKNRKLMETNELQIGPKNYNPQKDKCFSGSVKLPHIARPKMKDCMLGDAQHVEEAEKI